VQAVRNLVAAPTPETVGAGIVLEHLSGLGDVVTQLAAEAGHLSEWGRELCTRLIGGHRLLTCGNGGSAAEAQHLSAEIVGRFEGDRPPFSAIALHADSSSVTAIGNDYGFDEVFARQVTAHARPGDIVLLLSTSGRSPNLLRAAEAAGAAGATAWALTGPGPNPLAERCDDWIGLDSRASNVQEGQLIAIHAICCAFDAYLGSPAVTAPVAAVRPGGVR
jgi:type III pantothenate kinase